MIKLSLQYWLLYQGFAFVNYYRKEDAAKAIATLNGFGYDHLILRWKSSYISFIFFQSQIFILYLSNNKKCWLLKHKNVYVQNKYERTYAIIYHFEIPHQCGMGQACPGALGGWKSEAPVFDLFHPRSFVPVLSTLRIYCLQCKHGHNGDLQIKV